MSTTNGGKRTRLALRNTDVVARLHAEANRAVRRVGSERRRERTVPRPECRPGTTAIRVDTACAIGLSVRRACRGRTTERRRRCPRPRRSPTTATAERRPAWRDRPGYVAATSRSSVESVAVRVRVRVVDRVIAGIGSRRSFVHRERLAQDVVRFNPSPMLSTRQRAGDGALTATGDRGR